MYEGTDAGVKQTILQQADPVTARSLCQTDQRHRRLCRDNLSIEEKTRICLGDDKTATECDLIPMFSQQQFFSLIPKNIEIYPQDKVQLTHEFYSQQYKLATEGYSVALLKAKLMNTICAITRPDFFLTDVGKQLPLPKYVDVNLLNDVIEDFLFNRKADRDNDPYFEITVKFSNHQGVKGYLEVMYGCVACNPPYCYMLKTCDFALTINGKSLRDEFNTINRLINDDKYLKPVHHLHMVNDADLSLNAQHPLNAFEVSRIVKILFDRGYYHNMTVSTVGHNLKQIDRSI